MRNISVLLSIILIIQVSALAADYVPVQFETEDGGTVEASLFKASPKRAVVLAHGAVFNKESWYDLAGALRKEGVTALSIDFRGYGKSKAPNKADKHLDILAAVDFLTKKGYESISLLGGSMGGAAALRALDLRHDDAVDKVVLLAPAGGPPVKSPDADKLFIVSEGDRLLESTRNLHEKSSKPKRLEVLSGSAHAQHIFKTKEGPKLTDLIVSFLTSPAKSTEGATP